MRRALAISLAALAMALGVGIYVTDLPAYLGSDPATCNRCHVMDAAYEGWYHGGHRLWATCVDCHAPHALIPKYLYKGYAGARDAVFYTLNIVPGAIRADRLSRAIIRQNCVRCHAETVSAVDPGERPCVDCHRSVAHGPRGLSLLPVEDTGR